MVKPLSLGVALFAILIASAVGSGPSIKSCKVAGKKPVFVKQMVGEVSFQAGCTLKYDSTSVGVDPSNSLVTVEDVHFKPITYSGLAISDLMVKGIGVGLYSGGMAFLINATVSLTANNNAETTSSPPYAADPYGLIELSIAGKVSCRSCLKIPIIIQRSNVHFASCIGDDGEFDEDDSNYGENDLNNVCTGNCIPTFVPTIGANFDDNEQGCRLADVTKLLEWWQCSRMSLPTYWTDGGKAGKITRRRQIIIPLSSELIELKCADFTKETPTTTSTTSMSPIGDLLEENNENNIGADKTIIKYEQPLQNFKWQRYDRLSRDFHAISYATFYPSLMVSPANDKDVAYRCYDQNGDVVREFYIANPKMWIGNENENQMRCNIPQVDINAGIMSLELLDQQKMDIDVTCSFHNSVYKHFHYDYLSIKWPPLSCTPQASVQIHLQFFDVATADKTAVAYTINPAVRNDLTNGNAELTFEFSLVTNDIIDKLVMADVALRKEKYSHLGKDKKLLEKIGRELVKKLTGNFTYVVSFNKGNLQVIGPPVFLRYTNPDQKYPPIMLPNTSTQLGFNMILLIFLLLVIK